MKTYKQQSLVLILLFISYSTFAQVYLSWNEIETKRFGQESIYLSSSDKKALNGSYKISENSGAYADINFKNGKIDGNYISYDFSGKKISEATYKEGKIYGKQISYFQNGKVQEETYYKNGLKDGTWLTYNKENTIIRRENYKVDKKEGKWTKTLKNPAENTSSTVIEYYKDDKPIGHWEERLSDGKLRWEEIYSTPTDYIKKSYYPNGKLSEELIIKNRKKNGLATYNSPEGLLRYKVKYDNDHTIYKEQYFENGTLKSITNYKYGVINGLYERYNEEGIKIKEGTRKDTYKEGIWKTYEGKKGRLLSEITYSNDNENGTAKFYNTSANRLKKEGLYLNGKQHGLWKYYDMAGELIKEIEYNKGKQISEKKYN